MHMDLATRQQQFLDAIQKHFKTTKATRLNRLFGVSNSAKVVEGGLQIGVPNLNGAKEDAEAFIFACVMKFPPEDEVYFALLVRKDKAKFLDRLTMMKNLGAATKASIKPEPAANEGDDEDDAGTAIKYSTRNNLVAVYLASDGCLWLRNSGFWNSLNIDLTPFGPATELDEIVVALYPPAASARRSLLAREFIGWLGNLVGREKIHEIRVWTDAAAVNPKMQRLPSTIPMVEIEAAVKNAGGHYPHDEVRRYHAALNFLAHKHFVILSGLSGTGKTQLALRYARAIHGIIDLKDPDPFLVVCAVRPEWTDPTGLTGYYDVLSNRYVVPPFLEAVLLATAHPDSPVFVVLDEMNLARVEYYFSDVLSAIETGEALHLHSNSVPLEGSTGTSIRAELPLPQNLYITGTVNVDETTSPVSDKVLDRAIVLDMSNVDLHGFLLRLEEREPSLESARQACEDHLVATHRIMAEHGLGFGYRVTEEFVRYHAFAAVYLGASPETTTDDMMVQKVLVKLRGTEKQRSLLTGLNKLLTGLPRSQAFLARLLADLDEFGSFQASR
jgi:5-methylcytosine-specific restriction enzyme B